MKLKHAVFQAFSMLHVDEKVLGLSLKQNLQYNLSSSMEQRYTLARVKPF